MASSTTPSSRDLSSFGGDDDVELYVGLYRTMVRIRRVEDAVQSLFLRGDVHGTTHLYSGQEAVATGVASALDERDRVAGTYRGHGHALALGVGIQELIDELLGRATGVNGGRSGSMNVTSLRHRLLGCYGIVGGSIGAATGAALAMSLQRTGGVAVAFFGDGATNQAYFFECLNFAYSRKLPAIFVCENNTYGEYTRTADVSGGTILGRGESLGVPGEQVDGMDVWETRGAALRAVARARAGDGPSLIEASTYRFVGHSRSDPGRYRPEGELDAWRERDPLIVARARLIAGGVAERFLDELEAAVADEVAAAETNALAAPWPDPRDLPSEFARA
jgi:TPP-dependent pyruvate/acetoin dehydrogenase alpha subunit